MQHSAVQTGTNVRTNNKHSEAKKNPLKNAHMHFFRKAPVAHNNTRIRKLPHFQGKEGKSASSSFSTLPIINIDLAEQANICTFIFLYNSGSSYTLWSFCMVLAVYAVYRPTQLGRRVTIYIEREYCLPNVFAHKLSSLQMI